MTPRFALIVETESEGKRLYPITANWTSVGRSPREDIAFPTDTMVERNHLRIRWEGASLTLVDQGSPGRYTVNDTPVARNGTVPLKPGDRISLGRATLTVVQTTDPAPDPSL